MRCFAPRTPTARPFTPGGCDFRAIQRNSGTFGARFRFTLMYTMDAALDPSDLPPPPGGQPDRAPEGGHGRGVAAKEASPHDGFASAGDGEQSEVKPRKAADEDRISGERPSVKGDGGQSNAPARLPNTSSPNRPGPTAMCQEIAPELLHSARHGDPAAMHAFIRMYERRVFAFLSRATGHGAHVEDLAQEVFLRVFSALPRFELGRAKVSTWILQIAVRLTQDRKKRVQPVWVHETDELREERVSPEEQCQRRRALSRVERAVEQLPGEQRVTLVLFEFHGLSHQEIAEATGTPVSTIKTRLHRARSTLRAKLSEELEA